MLAWCRTVDGGVLAGTRDALYLEVDGDVTRIPWEQVEAADWDADTDMLRVSLVGSWGEQRVEHDLSLTEPGRLLELVRERVTASVVLQRHVPLAGRRGVRVIGRRAPRGNAPIEWFYEYDEGVDPARPGSEHGRGGGPRRGPRRRRAGLISQRRGGLARVLTPLSGPL